MPVVLEPLLTVRLRSDHGGMEVILLSVLGVSAFFLLELESLDISESALREVSKFVDMLLYFC